MKYKIEKTSKTSSDPYNGKNSASSASLESNFADTEYDPRFKDRARGMLLGLAIGDALGAPVEFLPAPSDYYIMTMKDKIAHFHKNHRLAPGAWTDDTSMALCLADSLLACGGYDSYDIMDKFHAWVYDGYRVCPGSPLDAGGQTLRALDDYELCPVVLKGTEKTTSAGNGAIMRLAPVIIANTFTDRPIVTLQQAYQRGALVIDPGDEPGEYIDLSNIRPTLEMAALSARETHDSVAAIAVTEIFAATLYLALHGVSKHNIPALVLRFLTHPESDQFYLEHYDALFGRAILSKDGHGLTNLGGYIVDSFTIAIWGLLHYPDFKSGMLAVIRLGGDTDTNAAIYGQLAGAYYGASSIPEEWVTGVAESTELLRVADALLAMPACPILRTRFEDDPHFQPPEN